MECRSRATPHRTSRRGRRPRRPAQDAPNGMPILGRIRNRQPFAVGRVACARRLPEAESDRRAQATRPTTGSDKPLFRRRLAIVRLRSARAVEDASPYKFCFGASHRRGRRPRRPGRTRRIGCQSRANSHGTRCRGRRPRRPFAHRTFLLLFLF